MSVQPDREAVWGEWRQRAACRGYDNPAAFFPVSEHPDDAEEAKAVCAGCPARVPCLEANLGEREGVYGGTTPKERRVIVRQRRLS